MGFVPLLLLLQGRVVRLAALLIWVLILLVWVRLTLLAQLAFLSLYSASTLTMIGSVVPLASFAALSYRQSHLVNSWSALRAHAPSSSQLVSSQDLRQTARWAVSRSV